MCNPLALAAASTGLQLMQKQDEADQITRAADVQQANINKATVQNYAQLNRQGVEEAQNQAVEQSKLTRELTSRVGTGRAQAGAAGLFGTSVNAMLLDLAGKGLDAKATSETNYARGVAARNDQAIELEQNATGQLSSVKRASGVGMMDVVGAGLKIGSTYYSEQAADRRAAMSNRPGTLAEQRAASLARMGSKPGGIQ